MKRAAFFKFPNQVDYPAAVPFDPATAFPELTGLPSGQPPTDIANPIYGAVRETLTMLGLDREQVGTPAWNPFRSLVGVGGKVVLKPNLVTHRHYKGEQGLTWSLSHPSCLRPLIDYALLAVSPSGTIVVADAPIENCEFQELLRVLKLGDLVTSLRSRGYPLEGPVDLRTFWTKSYPDGSIEQHKLAGDPLGYSVIDLGRHSLFTPLEDAKGAQNYYTLGDHSVDHMNPHSVAPGSPNQHHRPGRHVYRVANTILSADLVISLAKLKTHKFSGVTLSLKNAIGISDGKEFLPHRRPGPAVSGGDSFAHFPSTKYLWRLKARRKVLSIIGGSRSERLRKFIRRFIPQRDPHAVRSEPLFGNWHGNDTIWRTTLDLNLVQTFGEVGAPFNVNQPKRKLLAFIDGIIGMDHEAPMEGLPVEAGLLIAALDPVAADSLGAFLMGIDPRHIRTIENAREIPGMPLGDPHVALDDVVGTGAVEDAQMAFVPARGWEPLAVSRPDKWPYQ